VTYPPVSEVAALITDVDAILGGPLPESLARLFDVVLVLHHPVTDRGQRNLERAPAVGELVFDPRRNRGVDRPDQNPVVLEISQRNGQHALGDAIDRPVQFREAHPPVAEHHQKQDCPFVTDPRQDVSGPAAISGKLLWFNAHAANIRSITP
jgi:hypothetical protein